MSRPSSSLVFTPRGSRNRIASATAAKDAAPKKEVAATPTPQGPGSRDHSRQRRYKEVEATVAPTPGPLSRSASKGAFVPSKAAREESPDPTPAPAPVEDVVWEVVGGDLTNGILVRTDIGLSSAAAPTRLAKGAFVRAMEINGNRMLYRRISGAGPEMGWVSIKTQDKPLLKLVQNDAPKKPVDTPKSFDWKQLDSEMTGINPLTGNPFDKDSKVKLRRCASLPGKKRISFHFEDHVIEPDSEEDKDKEEKAKKEKEEEEKADKEERRRRKERERDTSPCKETSPEKTPKKTPASDTVGKSDVESKSPIISPDTVAKLAKFVRSEDTPKSNSTSECDADESERGESDAGALPMTDDEEDAGDTPSAKCSPRMDESPDSKKWAEHREVVRQEPFMLANATSMGRAWDFPLAKSEKRELLLLHVAAGERAQQELAALNACEADKEACARSRVEAKLVTTRKSLRESSSKARLLHSRGMKKSSSKGRTSSSRKPRRSGGIDQPVENEHEDRSVSSEKREQ